MLNYSSDEPCLQGAPGLQLFQGVWLPAGKVAVTLRWWQQYPHIRPFGWERGAWLQEGLLCMDCAPMKTATPKKQHPFLIHVLTTSLLCGRERAFVLGNCMSWTSHNLNCPLPFLETPPHYLNPRRSMRSQGSLADKALFHLHKYLFWPSISTSPLHQV